jgi:hypothetical protein
LRNAADKKLKKLQDCLFVCRYTKRLKFSTRYAVCRMLFRILNCRQEKIVRGYV